MPSRIVPLVSVRRPSGRPCAADSPTMTSSAAVRTSVRG